MNYDRTCDTCRYHGSRGVCVCPKSEEFRDVTVNTYCSLLLPVRMDSVGTEIVLARRSV